MFRIERLFIERTIEEEMAKIEIHTARAPILVPEKGDTVVGTLNERGIRLYAVREQMASAVNTAHRKGWNLSYSISVTSIVEELFWAQISSAFPKKHGELFGIFYGWVVATSPRRLRISIPPIAEVSLHRRTNDNGEHQ